MDNSLEIKLTPRNMIFKCLFGSHLYGTTTPKSDLDYKGIVLPSTKDLLLQRGLWSKNYSNNQSHEKNKPSDVDFEVHSLHKFVKLAYEGQMVAIDMLHCNEENIIQTSPIWQDLCDKRYKFYTKNMSAFLGYVRKQAAKYGVKGSRLSAMKEVTILLMKANPDDRVATIIDSLPINEHAEIEVREGANGTKQRFYRLCGRYYQETDRIFHMLNSVKKMYKGYGARALQAEQNEGIDWKAVSHAMRAAYQLKAIYTEGSITFPLPEAKLLLKVKNGELHYKRIVEPTIEALVEEVESLAKASEYPEEGDWNYWENWLMGVYELDLKVNMYL